ncbi:MAG: formimidoylglutamate deiminase [Myxococcota bacterium]
MSEPIHRLEVEHLHQPGGWLSPGFVEVDAHGVISVVSATRPASWDGATTTRVRGFVIPGMPNLHSHAFQRAMAGLAESSVAGKGNDSFWVWRNVMYGFAARIHPDDVEFIAAQLYVEMLKAGMTSVGEFHYLHHAPDGKPYDNPAELGLRILAAAHRAGIALTHLPVLYAHAGIGKPPLPQQARFIHADVDTFLRNVQTIRALLPSMPLLRVGIAPHSLRAVSADELTAAVHGITALDANAPIHIHIAEQTGEVDEVVREYKARPVQWLLDHHDVGTRWCLVHATHLDEQETSRLARSGAIAGLCPTTEANLGDGIFPAPSYLSQDGRFGVGSDSHISVGASEELRVLEYGQRLITRRRTVLVDEKRAGGLHVGRHLYDLAVSGGAQALAQPVGALVPGQRADLVVLDGTDPKLAGHGVDTVLDAYVFSTAHQAVKDVMVGGRWVVQDRRHPEEEAIRAAYVDALTRLRSQA